ncbi:chymotrypsin-1-like [Hermetia illucens]|nr:chymotrypsin-1-like [Hermetia illucens]XP_037916643.1 chymotrypsin-1-like [Hermetia illucens]
MSPLILALASVFILSSVSCVNHHLHIAGGKDAKIEDYPYQISLRDLRSPYLHICGGALYRTNVVITAAHCVYGRQETYLQVQGGTADRMLGGVISSVQKVLIHPQFDYDRRFNDVALVYLTNAFLPNGNQIATIEIANSSEMANTTMAIVSGWGKEGSNTQFSQTLKYLNVNIMQNRDCNEVLGGITDKMVCAVQSAPSGTCTGDSGDPLVIEVNAGKATKKKLIGTVSFISSGECAFGQPTAYMRMESYKSWIDTN